ncbi:MAG: hypothetical protein NT029_04620 [Armatimonadetes bacterium]|nr:hypothetical protein [Armatimonadota bacterium]
MASFAISYSERDDSLSAWFDGLDDGPVRISLSDNIEITFSRGMTDARSIHLQEFGRLLLVSETELTGLQEMEADQFELVYGRLREWPLSRFVRVTDIELLTARVEAPSIGGLLARPAD